MICVIILIIVTQLIKENIFLQDKNKEDFRRFYFLGSFKLLLGVASFLWKRFYPAVHRIPSLCPSISATGGAQFRADN